MLPKKKRLPRKEFVFQGHHSIKTDFFSLKAKLRENGNARIAVIVGKSVSKKAVQRNFWKRQGKSVLQAAGRDERDYLLTIFPNVEKITRVKFRNELKSAVVKLG